MSEGLSNAAVERIYAARLPLGHPPNELLHVELSPGGSILAVPVPPGTQPGSDVLFKAPDEDDEDPTIEVLIKGRLAKKSPKSSRLATVWQTRWFELQPSHLAYWELKKVEGAVKKGYIALSELVGVRAHKTAPCRFDLLLKSKRLFELKAESQADRDAAKKVKQIAADQSSKSDITAAPVIVQAAYASRVQRAKVANKAKRVPTAQPVEVG